MSSIDKPPDTILSTKNPGTVIVYICDGRYGPLLFTSMRSLLASGSHFDSIIIFCIGKKPDYWDVIDPRITIREVDPLMDNYFMINKCYAFTVEADRLIYLDVDTIILKPIDIIYQDSQADFLGRIASHYCTDGKQRDWLDILEKYEARNVPYFNAGFYIFQNNSHRELFNIYKTLTYELFEGNVAENFHEKGMAEQMALSIALGKSSLSYQCMTQDQHCFRWAGDSYEDCIVYHTGPGNYFRSATMLEVKYGYYKLNLPKFKSGFNRIIISRWLRFLAYKGFISQFIWFCQRLRGRG